MGDGYKGALRSQQAGDLMDILREKIKGVTAYYQVVRCSRQFFYNVNPIAFEVCFDTRPAAGLEIEPFILRKAINAGDHSIRVHPVPQSLRKKPKATAQVKDVLSKTQVKTIKGLISDVDIRIQVP